MEPETVFLLALILVEILFIGVFSLLLPRITRRGLLFGVYVGEETAGGAEARRLTRRWQGQMCLWTAGAVIATLAAFAAGAPVWGIVPPVLLLTIGFYASYLRVYRRAQRLASPRSAPAVAILTTEDPGELVFPRLVLVVSLAASLFALAYTALHYSAMPERIPTHFDFSGAPDGWSRKSAPLVFLLPSLSLIMAAGLGILSMWTARAKRALRYPHTAASLAAQLTFRRALTRFLGGVTLLAVAMLSVDAIYAVRTALGLSPGLPAITMVLGVALFAYALGGAIFLAVRLGQGGARLEGAAASASLTDGLADNRRWLLGMFYVNRDDPAILVEHRFGLGYTLNLGNRKAVFFLVAFLGLILGVSILALLLV